MTEEKQRSYSQLLGSGRSNWAQGAVRLDMRPNLIASFLACIHRWRRGGVLQGYLVLISTHMSEIGEEQFSGRFFEEGMTDVSYSPELRQAIAAGPTSIKVSTLPKALKAHDVARYFKRLGQPGKLYQAHVDKDVLFDCLDQKEHRYPNEALISSASHNSWDESVLPRIKRKILRKRGR